MDDEESLCDARIQGWSSIIVANDLRVTGDGCTNLHVYF